MKSQKHIIEEVLKELKFLKEFNKYIKDRISGSSGSEKFYDVDPEKLLNRIDYRIKELEKQGK